MIKSFDHYALTVSDMDRSIEFYRDILGLPVMGKLVREDGVFAYLDFGNSTVELFEFDKKGKANEDKAIEDIGMQHLAFTVDNVDDVTEKLKEEGVEFTVDPKNVAGVRQAFFKDPDGVLIEILEGELELQSYE